MPTNVRQPAAHRIVWHLNEAGFVGAHKLWRIALRFAQEPEGLLEMPDRSLLAHEPSDYVSRQLYHGGYERAERWACRRLIRPGAVVVDVGANIGLYAQMAARLVGAKGQVIAFEPGPALLRLRLAVAGLDNVDVVATAVGDRTGVAVLHVPAHQSGLASLRPDADRVAGRSVPVVRLDDHRTLPPGEIDLVKIDVEGYEEQVLHGARGLYEQGRIRATLVEVSPSFGPTEFVEQICEQYGLKALTVGYRRRLRYSPVTHPYDPRQAREAGQVSVLLLRSGVDWTGT